MISFQYNNMKQNLDSHLRFHNAEFNIEQDGTDF